VIPDASIAHKMGLVPVYAALMMVRLL